MFHVLFLALQTEREQQLRQLQDVLVSLWEAVGLQENMPERDEFDKLMAAPSCLHADNLEQVCFGHKCLPPALPSLLL